jgi:lysophospholipase L1-like esterase
MIIGIGRIRSLLTMAAGAFTSVLVLAALPGAAAASSMPTPPFDQCPAIGQSPSCQILLVVNPDQSVSVLGDSSVGPYDGSDDTLVGILNNSSSPITAVTVSGSGSDLAGFDGDGICTYAAGGGHGPGFAGDSYCTTQQIAGDNPEDYAGPGTSFTLDPNSQDDVEVDFAGSGLAARHSTYFSLEGALTAAVVTARKGGLGQTDYVALGDSFSSGEGNPPFIELSSGCDRSASAAWPELVASMFGIKLDLMACSGAKTSALYQTFKGQKPQLKALSSLTPKLVTVTMGGDDLDFPYDIAGCFLDLGDSCPVAVAWIEANLAHGFGQRMTAAYKKIKAAAHGANVLVVGYPQLISGNPITVLRHCLTVTPQDVLLMRAVAKQLNSVLARAAAAAGVSYVSTLNALEGHELCTAHPWINSVYSGRFDSRGHPTAQGQALMAAAVEDYVVLHHLLPGV